MTEEESLVLRVGIASPEQVRRRMLDIVSGKRRHQPEDPKIWFASVAEAYRVLSSETMVLLELIRAHEPSSFKDLAVQIGENESEVRSKVRELNDFGLVELEKTLREEVPRVKYDRLLLDLPLSANRVAA
jgi:predicted transcriptional regulator